MALIIPIIFILVFIFLKYKIDKDGKLFSPHDKIRAKNLEYEEVKCETNLNVNAKYYGELMFNQCKISCDKDSLYIFDNHANPIIVRKKMRKINSIYVYNPTHLNTNSFANAVHIEFELDKNSITNIIYTIRLFNVSDSMKQKINSALQD